MAIMMQSIFDKVSAVRAASSDTNHEDVIECRNLDICEENKALRSEIFAAYLRLQSAEDRLASQEALIALTDTEKNARLSVAENDLSMRKALNVELQRQNATLEYKIHELERLSVQASVDHVQYTSLKKEMDKLRENNANLESSSVRQKECILELTNALAMLKEENLNANKNAELLKQQRDSGVAAFEKLTIEHEALVTALEPLKSELAQVKTAHANSVLQGQILEVEILSEKSELRHLDQKCLSLNKEVVKLKKLLNKRALEDRIRDDASNDISIAPDVTVCVNTPLVARSSSNGSRMSTTTAAEHAGTGISGADFSDERLHHDDDCGCVDIFRFTTNNSNAQVHRQQYKYSGHTN